MRILLNKLLGYFCWIFKLEKTFNKPIIRGIEPTNACMMNCIMCPRKNMKRKVEYMDFELFKKIVNQAKWNDNIWLHHFGDPLLHPKIEKMVRYITEKGINAKMSVNPNLLSKKMCEKLICSGLDTIVISVDGTDDKMYKYIRGKNADYNKAVENIENLLKLKKETKSKLKIDIQMIKMKINKNDVEKFKKIWNKEGVDSITIKQFNTFDGSDAKILGQGDIETFSKRFLEKNMDCSEPWIGITVTASGKVVPCCYDYDEKYVVGDLKKDSLIDIWNNKNMRLLRKQIKTKTLNKNPLCRTCKERKNDGIANHIKFFLKRKRKIS